MAILANHQLIFQIPEKDVQLLKTLTLQGS